MAASPVTIWLLVGAAAVVALQLALVGALVARGAWAAIRVRRLRARSRIVRDLLEMIELEPSVHVRRQLADARLGRDLHALQTWIDAIAQRGADPAGLDSAVYEDAGLVDHYLRVLREHRNWTQRAAAASILGWTASPAAVRPLLQCVQDLRGESRAVRSVALRALGRIRHPDAVAPLVDALTSTETWLPPAVAAMLGRIGPTALPTLVRELSDDASDPLTRRWAAQILGDIGDRRALPALLGALGDLDGELRARAARALGSIGDARAEDALLERLLVDPVPFVRTAVAKALGAVGSERAIQLLVESLADPEWWVRLRAVEALEQLGPAARDLLVAALSDPDPQVCREAARALEGIGVIAQSLETLRSEGYAPAVGELLVEVGRAGNIEPLLDELENDDERMLRIIVRVLSRIGDRRAGPALVLLLERRLAPGLRARAVDAIRRVGDPTHVARVIPLLHASDEWLRMAAVDYVAAFGGPETIEAISPLVEDSNPWTRESALRVLERLRPGSSLDERLLGQLDDEFDFVRAQAARTLCAVHAFEALVEAGVLERLVEPGLRDALLEGLRDAARASALPLIRQLAAFCADQDLDRLQSAARAALEDLPQHEVQALVRACLDSDLPPSDRWLAAVAWPRAVDDLRARALPVLFEDNDPRVTAALLNSLTRQASEVSDLDALLRRALDHAAPMVLRAALFAAITHRPQLLRAALPGLLGHVDPDVRIDALLARTLSSDRGGRTAASGLAHARDLRIRLAMTIGHLARGHHEAITPWLQLLDDEAAMEELGAWEKESRPLLQYALALAERGSSLAQRLLSCRTAFEAERLLVEELENAADSQMRLLALEGIASVGSERGSGRVLAAFLRDRSAAVRARALRELVQIDAFGRRRQFLEQAFEDPDPRIQISAAHLCAKLGAAEGAALLARQLVSRRPTVIQAVTDILAGMLEQDYEAVLERVLGLPETPERLMGLVLALEKTPGDVSTQLIDSLLTHRWAKVRAETLRALLPRRRATAWEILERATDDTSPRVRERAVASLVDPRLPELRSDRAACKALLESSITDPSPQVRSRVALVLREVHCEGRARMLEALVRDPNERVARIARRSESTRKQQRDAHRVGAEVPVP